MATNRLLMYLPPSLRFSAYDVQSMGIWGGTVALGALWMVQPWHWINNQINPPPPAASDGGSVQGTNPKEEE